MSPARDEFLPNSAIEAAQYEYCRFPTDPDPCVSNSQGACFACKYRRPTGALDHDELDDASNSRSLHDELLQMIDRFYGETSNTCLVDLIYEFYEKEIRAFRDFGEWSKESIWEHITLHRTSETVQLGENLRTLDHALAFMRSSSLCKREKATGLMEIDNKNMRLFMDMCKLRMQMAGDRSKR